MGIIAGTIIVILLIYICFLHKSLRSLKIDLKGKEEVEVSGACDEITEMKQMEAALKLSEAKYRFITENILDLVGVWNLQGIVTYASPSHELVMGYMPKDYEGEKGFQWVHPDDLTRLQLHFNEILSTKLPGQIEFQGKHANGTWISIEAQINPVLSSDGEVEYFIAVGRDITERKKTDEIIRKAEKLSVVGQLAAGVAHEIRNPLTSIKGFLQLLQKESVNPKYIHIMLSEIEDIENIVTEFLSFAKPQTSKMSTHDINVLLQYVITLIRTQAILKNIEIVLEKEIDLPPIYCDGHQIKQVFINILRNAVEAMTDSGVITINVSKFGLDQIKFSFHDQGIGIAEDRIKNIGEPFYSTKEKGTGLGMMISHKIVQDHGGMIDIESKINQGTTVNVILPIEQSHCKIKIVN